MRLTNHKMGLWAEFLAAAFLTFKGYRVLTMRAKTPVGEIDIVATKGKTLIAIEVKRSTRHATLERVDARKQERVTRALQYLQTQKTYSQFNDFRFDVIALAGWRICHIINAW